MRMFETHLRHPWLDHANLTISLLLARYKSLSETQSLIFISYPYLIYSVSRLGAVVTAAQATAKMFSDERNPLCLLKLIAWMCSLYEYWECLNVSILTVINQTSHNDRSEFPSQTINGVILIGRNKIAVFTHFKQGRSQDFFRGTHISQIQ